MKRQQNLAALDMRLQRLTRHHQRVTTQLESIYSFRLIVGTVFFVLLVFVAMKLWLQLLTITELGLVVAFVLAVRFSRRLEKHLTQVDNLIGLYQRISRRLIFQASNVILHERNEQWIHHPLSQDLDLVGSNSLLNMLDETIHVAGQTQLIEAVIDAKFTEKEVALRQHQLKELAKFAGLSRKYLRSSNNKIMDRAHGLTELVTESFIFKDFSRVHTVQWALCCAFWLALVIQVSFDFKTHWGIIWLSYFFYMIFSLRKVEKTFSRLQNIIVRLEALIPTFQIVERIAQFETLKTNLKEFQNSPVQAFRKFETGFAFLSVQSHPIFLFLINSLVPWNYFFVSRVEKQRSNLSLRINSIFSEFAWVDSMVSLGIFHRYLTQTFPTIGESLQVQEARHPLIPVEKNVANDFHWPIKQELVLVTGSNMAGKSTFLRTVGLNFVLARMGAPVFASRFSFPLVPLKTCIRVSDNVREGFSYFYAETTRVAEILKSAKKQKIFYLIDEVFKGTNNRERFIGGKALIEGLVQTSSFGFVTTHDLELSKLENSEIANYHFKDEIRGNDMHFSYKIAEGPCPTTNALKIMSLAGIPV